MVKKILMFACTFFLVAVLGACQSVAPDIKAGNKAPDFELQSLDGEPRTLSGLKGQPVVLNFWALSCPYCLDEMPYLQQIHDDYGSGNNNLAMLAINIGDSNTSIKNYIDENGFDFTVLTDNNRKVAEQYGIRGIPVTIFIDKNGIIQDVVIGAFRNATDIETRLQSILS